MSEITRYRPSRRLVLTTMAGAGLAGAARAQGLSAPTQTAWTIASMRHALRPGAPESDVIGVNGAFPAPVLRARKGQTLALSLTNRLPEPAAVQIHGLRGGNGAEAVPGLNAPPIAPGETRTLALTFPDSGTFLYLPVLQGKSAEQRERGLAGMVVVEEASPPAVDLEQLAMLDDVALGPDGLLTAQFDRRSEGARFGRLGNTLTINGDPAPITVTARPNARVRLRLASVANARMMPLKFQGGRQTVVALDGQACEPFDPLKRTVVLLPGSRYEVMVDIPAEEGQESIVYVDSGSLHKVLILKAEGAPLPVRPPVGPLGANDVPAAIRLQNAARSEMTISGGLERAAAGQPSTPDEAELARRWPDPRKIFQINNGFNTGFGGKPILTVKRGGPVVLALTNRTAWSQTLTVHGHVFRLLHPLDDGWEPYFLDTIHLPAQTTSRIAFDAANPGRWAIRSTIAEHYDAGVASWFEVL